jgi:phosphate transport system permease protein
VAKKKKLKKAASGISFNDYVGRKHFRLGEWVAENFIKTMAFASIAFVILIFIFVFREAFPIFKGTQSVQEEMPASDMPLQQELKPETYNSGTEETGTGQIELRPEVYSPGDAGTMERPIQLSPETYDPDKDYSGESVPADSDASYFTLQENLRNAENARARSTLFTDEWQPVSSNPRYGILPLIAGTLKVTIIAILFAAPLAILAALYTSVFAPKKIREYIKPAIELLAGFPSVVIGFFALMILATFFQDIFGYASRLNSFVGGIAMALASIPVIYTISEDALTAVPKTYSEASLGLGASERQTAFKVILPAATPGIFAAILLGIGRVFGETMIALMATGNAAISTINPFDPVRTLSATIGAEMAEVVFGDTHYSVLFLIGSLLFIFTFGLNALAEFYFKKRVMKRIQGK